MELSARTKIQSHKTTRGTIEFQWQLPGSVKEKVARPAAFAFCLDIRQLEFSDGHQGTHQFAQTVFEMDQMVQASQSIDLASYLPKIKVVTNAVRDKSLECRQKFITDLKDGLLQYWGAISVEGFHLKV